LDILEVKEHLLHATQVVAQAGEIALRYFRRPILVENKQAGADFDPVTLADREVEAFIRQQLARAYPDYGISGEEGGETPPKKDERIGAGAGGRRWVIDPIDGTRAFISGVPTWGILLGLVDNDRAVGGIMHQPYLGESFFGTGQEAWMTHRGDHVPLRSHQNATLDQARLYCTHPDMFSRNEDLDAFRRVADAVRLMRYGGDCYSYCLLAMGHIDLVIEGSLQPYDILPLIPIIEGSGGVVTDIEGNCPMEGGLVIAAANKSLHQQAIDLMRQ